MTFRLPIPFRTLGARPDVLLRIALVPVIWGLALSLWFSLGRAVLSHSLPPVEAQVEREAAHFADRLNGLATRGNTLVTDDRITAGTDNQADTVRRRALYEFSYLQNTRDVYVADPKGKHVWSPLNAQELPLSAIAMGNGVGRNGIGAIPVMVSKNTSLLMLVQRHVNGETVIGSLAPWSTLRQPTVFTANGAPLILFFHNGDRWWQLNMSTGAAHTTGRPDLRIDRELLGLAPTVTAAAAVPGWDGWWVSANLNVLKESKTVFALQIATLAAALMMSLFLIWNPWSVTATTGSGGRRNPQPHQPGQPGNGGIGGFWGDLKGRIKPIGDTGTFYHGADTADGTGALSETRKAAPAAGASATKQQYDRQRQRDSIHFASVIQKIRGAMDTPNGVRGLYQPIFRASDGMAVMNEVLLRLSIPNNEDMTPDDFLSVAKRANMMPALDASLLKAVLAQNFKDGMPGTKLALNVSSTTFDHMIYMREIVQATNPAVMNHLVFELRSRELIGDKGAMEFLFQLKSMGAQLSVDYFGGASMLDMSKRMGFDHVKINALEMWDDLNKRRELVGLAKSAARIGLPLILEKVETLQMEVFARRIGIPYLQGYHFAKPAPEPVTGQMVAWRHMAKEAASQVTGQTGEPDAAASADASTPADDAPEGDRRPPASDEA